MATNEAVLEYRSGSSMNAPAGPDAPAIRRLPGAPRSRTRTADVLAVAGFVVAVTVGLWIRHGGLGMLLAGGTDTLLGLGQLSGLVAALGALGAIVLTARPRFLEQRYGLDGMLALHRWFGIITVFAVLVHTIADTWGWASASGTNVVAAALDLMAHEKWMVAAFAAGALFLIIGLSSWRRVRNAMSYETWYFVHLLAYLAVLLGFGHQLTLGTDFASDSFATWWWIAVAVGTVAIVIWARCGVVLRSLTQRFYVKGAYWEADRIGSLHLSGPGISRISASAGQFFMVRPLARGLWWQAHPYSLSAAPTTAGLRFSIKETGEDSASILRVRPGTRVLLEGPYGTFTARASHGAPVLLIAAGVGIAPIRAILEDCRPEQTPVVMVRVSKHEDLAHRGELERLVASRNGHLVVLAGGREYFAANDPFRPEALRRAIPDIADRHVFICGPRSLEAAAIKGLRKAGVPTAHVHHEDFGV